MKRIVLSLMAILLLGLFVLPLVGQGAYPEDMINFHWQTAQIRTIGGSIKIVDGNMSLLDFGSNAAEAQMALAIIRQYRLNQQCFVARPNPPMEYWLASGRAPVGPFPGEDSIAFDNTNIRVAYIGGSWKIVEGTSHSMLDFGANERAAWQSLWTIWKYDFNHICFVGRPDPSMVYFRK